MTYSVKVEGGKAVQVLKGQVDGLIASASPVGVGWDHDAKTNTFSEPAQVKDMDALREQAVLSRFDFASAVAAAGYVTYDEAIDWAAGNAIPAQFQPVIDALPAAEQGPAKLDALTRNPIRRNGTLMPALAATFGATDDDLDALFGI